MKQKALAVAAAVFILVFFSVSVWAEPLLIPVGQTVGLQLRDNTVTIAAFDDALGAEARQAGLKIGDRILRVNGQTVHNAQQIRRLLDESGGAARLTLLRGSKELEAEIPIVSTADGAKLGVYLKQGISGIGTVTWYDPATGCFGALGHGVNGSSGVPNSAISRWLTRPSTSTTSRAVTWRPQ